MQGEAVGDDLPSGAAAVCSSAGAWNSDDAVKAYIRWSRHVYDWGDSGALLKGAVK